MVQSHLHTKYTVHSWSFPNQNTLRQFFHARRKIYWRRSTVYRRSRENCSCRENVKSGVCDSILESELTVWHTNACLWHSCHEKVCDYVARQKPKITFFGCKSFIFAFNACVCVVWLFVFVASWLSTRHVRNISNYCRNVSLCVAFSAFVLLLQRSSHILILMRLLVAVGRWQKHVDITQRTEANTLLIS